VIYLLLRGLAALAALLLALSLLFGLFGKRRRWRLWLGLGIVFVLFVAASEAVTPCASSLLLIENVITPGIAAINASQMVRPSA